MNLAANLHPPLSEYDLLRVLTAHYPYEVQTCMISANLKWNQEALTLLGKLQTMNEERKAHKENSLETKEKFSKEGKQTGRKYRLFSNLIRTSFADFLNEKNKKLVRGSNPHLSFSCPLPTGQTDSVMTASLMNSKL